jgi:hypothetical protein
MTPALWASFWRGARRGVGYASVLGGFVGFALCVVIDRPAIAALYFVVGYLGAAVLDQVAREGK